jgi:hypothetical protein
VGFRYDSELTSIHTELANETLSYHVSFYRAY